MKESIKDLEAIRIALQFKKWAFAGHSTGGMLGLVYAIQAPESLTNMIIGGAATSKEYMNHPGNIYCKENPNNERLGEIMRAIMNQTTLVEKKRPLSREWTEMSLYRPENYEQYFNKPNSGSTVPQRLDYYSYTELPNYDLTAQLSTISVPTTVYCGGHDAQCPHVHMSFLSKLLVKYPMLRGSLSMKVTICLFQIAFSAVGSDYFLVNLCNRR